MAEHIAQTPTVPTEQPVLETHLIGPGEAEPRHEEGITALAVGPPEDTADDGDDEQAKKSTAIQAATRGIAEAHQEKSLESILSTLDFSPESYDFFATGSYQAESKPGEFSTRHEGKGKLHHPQYYDKEDLANTNKWGNPGNEAHYTQRPVEKVGIQKGPTQVWTEVEKKLPRRSIAGRLGFKKSQMVPELKEIEPEYRFDYEFAAPSHSEDDAALDAGNRTGQNIRLSMKLTQEQAEDLSAILAEDPTAARTILDKFVAATHDNGMWGAEIFDENGVFHDPRKRYGNDFLARDVRPRYEAVPDLKPEIIGLTPKTAN